MPSSGATFRAGPQNTDDAGLRGASYHLNPFDLTKVWPHGDYPLIEIGKMVLDRNPDNYFAEVEQAAFDPGHFVPGIGPSPDKMLQGQALRLRRRHRYRLGINHTQLPINRPQATKAENYGRDGAMRFEPTTDARRTTNRTASAVPPKPVSRSRLSRGGPSGTYGWDDTTATTSPRPASSTG